MLPHEVLPAAQSRGAMEWQRAAARFARYRRQPVTAARPMRHRRAPTTNPLTPLIAVCRYRRHRYNPMRAIAARPPLTL